MKSWTGELTTKQFDADCIKSIWEHGYNEAFDYLIQNGYTRNELTINDKRVDILNPLDFTNRNSIHRDQEEDEDYVFEEQFSVDREEADFEFMISDDFNNNQEFKFPNTVEHEGLVYHKSNVISNIIHCSSKLSRELQGFTGLKKTIFVSKVLATIRWRKILF